MHVPPGDAACAAAGGRLLIADFRPPRNPFANHLIGALSGHAMQQNPIGELASLIGDAGFEVVDSGDRAPWLHYVRGRRAVSSDAQRAEAPA